MSEPQATLPFPSRFRRRLTVSFVIVAGVATGIVATAGYLLNSQQRNDSFISRSRQQAEIAIALTQGQNSADQLNALVSQARQRTGFETLVVADRVISSKPMLKEEDLPKSVLKAKSSGLAMAFMKLDNQPYLVFGEDVPNSSDHARLYLLFSEKAARDQLGDLRRWLLTGWFVVTALSAAIGSLIARRTLAPIQQSADAAKSLAEGLLETRLPATGNDEFGSLARAFNEMATALENKINELAMAHERERQFTADIAHDLRTPVTGIVNSSTLLLDRLGELPEPARKSAGLLERDIERLHKLVDDLLELANLESSRTPPVYEAVDLHNIMNALASATQIYLDELVTPDFVVQVDRLRLERVLYNLFSNAAVHGGGIAKVRASIEGNQLVITVEDNGPGIPPETLPHIFDRFHKASRSRATEGSGLGLAIASQYANRLHGTLTAANRKGGGACFTLTLPIPSENPAEGSPDE